MKSKRTKNNTTDEHWGIRLQKTIAEKKLSTRELARQANVSSSVVAGWLKGSSPTDLVLIKNLCEKLEINFTWLLTGTYDKEKPFPNLVEIFDEVPYFDGYARIRIDRLIHKGKKP